MRLEKIISSNKTTPHATETCLEIDDPIFSADTQVRTMEIALSRVTDPAIPCSHTKEEIISRFLDRLLTWDKEEINPQVAAKCRELLGPSPLLPTSPLLRLPEKGNISKKC